MNDLIFMGKVALNDIKFTRGRNFFRFFLQPYGNGLVMALPYWLFSTILNDFVVILCFPCHFLFWFHILTSSYSFHFSASIFECKTSTNTTKFTYGSSFKKFNLFSVSWKSNQTLAFTPINTVTKRTSRITFSRVKSKHFL